MAKKKRRRGGAGVDVQERRRERLEERRAAKTAALEAQARRARRRRAIRIALYAGALVALAWFFFFRTTGPDEINGHPIRTSGTTGVGQHTEQPVDYDTTPPVSGAHAGQLQFACGVHATQIPNEQQVHMLEHGAVGIQYRPDLPIDQIRRIEEIVRDSESDVFSAPYDGLPSPIVLSSWGRFMELDRLEPASIREYIDEFAGDAPEAGAECQKGSNQPFEPPPTPTPGATPEASPTA